MTTFVILAAVLSWLGICIVFDRRRKATLTSLYRTMESAKTLTEKTREIRGSIDTKFSRLFEELDARRARRRRPNGATVWERLLKTPTVQAFETMSYTEKHLTDIRYVPEKGIHLTLGEPFKSIALESELEIQLTIKIKKPPSVERYEYLPSKFRERSRYFYFSPH